jgi:hypothetical protein
MVQERWERGKGTKGSERVVGKVAGDKSVFYTWRRSELADEIGPTPYRTRWAVKAITGPLNRMA